MPVTGNTEHFIEQKIDMDEGDHKHDFEKLQEIERKQNLKTQKFRAIKKSGKIVDKMINNQNKESGNNSQINVSLSQSINNIRQIAGVSIEEKKKKSFFTNV